MIAAIRDIAIIVLAVESIVVGILLIVLILEIRNLARMLQTEVKPMLASLNETAATVKGTTTFLSNNVAQPFIRASSVAAGVGGVLSGLRRKND